MHYITLSLIDIAFILRHRFGLFPLCRAEPVERTLNSRNLELRIEFTIHSLQFTINLKTFHNCSHNTLVYADIKFLFRLRLGFCFLILISIVIARLSTRSLLVDLVTIVIRSRSDSTWSVITCTDHKKLQNIDNDSFVYGTFI